jgi:DNA repair exonuclease SbcCD ATPase subunit/predicted phosphodiesterase
VNIGIFSDTHYCNYKTFAGSLSTFKETGLSKRLIEQREASLCALEIFKKENANCIIHAGDWVDSVGVVYNEVLNVIKQIVNDAKSRGMQIITTIGNHDTPVRAFPKQVNFITNVISDFAGGFTSVSNIKIVNFHDEVNYDEIKGYKIVVLHKTPINCKVGKYTFDEGVDWKKLAQNNDFVFFGHIHQSQKLSNNCFVIGSLTHLNFGDEGERGVFIVDTERNLVKFCEVKSPKFFTVNKLEEIQDNYNYYRLLGSDKNIVSDNVISVKEPIYYEERLKSDNFDEMLNEWLKINNKEQNYIKYLNDIIKNKLTVYSSVIHEKIKNIAIHNFCSVENAKFEIKNGFNLILGESDTLNSNGSGKTSIFCESLFWCLFGETTKGITGNDVIRNIPKIQNDCFVEIMLGEYIIKRSRKSGLSIKKDGKNVTDGMKEVNKQKILEDEILGFNKETFLASVYFSQENLNLLTNLSDNSRTDIISNLLGFELYSENYELISKTIKVSNELISESKSKLAEYEKLSVITTERHSSILRDIETHSKEITKIKKKIKTTKEKLHHVEYDLTDLVETEDEKQHDKKIKELKDRIKRNEGEFVKRETNISSLKEELKINNESISDLRKQKFGERCNKCGSTIDKTSVEIFLNDKQIKAEELTKKIKSGETFNIEIKNDLVTLNSELNKCESLKEEIRGKNSRIENMSIELNKKHDIFEENLEEHQKELCAALPLVNKLNEELKTNVKEFEEISKKIESIKFGIDRINNEIEIYEFWKLSFSPKGIKSLLLDRFCNEINKVLAYYISVVSNGSMSVFISPVSILKSGEERNKINIEIMMKDYIRDYKMLSGGEKRRVDIAMCFGLNKWVKNKYNLNGSSLLGLMIMDEVFSGLDSLGVESVANLISEEGRSRSIYVISHDDAFISFADNIINVKKENGVSKIL